MTIANEKFLSLTTYRKNGEAKETPIWIADLGDGTMGFTTHGESWKCKRIRNDNRIAVQPCNQSGKIMAGTEKVSGTAVLASGADFTQVQTAIKKKYGFMVTVVGVMNKVRKLMGKGGPSNTAVIITLD